MKLKGVQYIVDEKGKRKAIVLDWEEWGELWEDLCDVLVAESRRDEPTIPWDELKAELQDEKRP